MKFVPALAIAAGVLISGQAHSADIAARPYLKAPPIAYLPWNSTYVGVTVGYTSPETDPTLTPTDPGSTLSVTLGNVNTRPGAKSDGVIGGLTLGINRQYDRVVLGLETDISGSSARSRFLSIQGPNIVTNTGDQQTDVLGTFRARLGYAFDRTLFYGTGGLAYGHVKNSFTIVGPAIPGATDLLAAEDKWKVGWTVGGGIEHIFSPSWSLKAEYLYYDLGDSQLNYVTTRGPVETAVVNYKNTGHIARVGLNYHFNAF